MVDVDHQVAHLQVGVAQQPLAAVGLGLAGLFGLAGQGAGQLPLRQDGQLQGGPLAAGGQRPHGDERLARGGDGIALQRQGGGDMAPLEELLHITAADRAAAEHQHAEAGGQIVGDVGGGGIQAAAVAGELLGADVQQQAGRQQIAAGGQALQLAEGKAGEHRLQLRLRKGQVAEGAGHETGLHGGGNILTGLEQKGPERLLHPAGLAGTEDGVLGQIVKRGGLVRADGGHIAVRAGWRDPLAQQFGIIQQTLTNGGVLLLQAAGGILDAPGGVGGGGLFGKGQQLRCRQNTHLAAVQHAALCGCLEFAQAIQLVVEKLTTQRALLSGGEHVQNTAPQGKLTGPLHLIGAGVSGGGQAAAEVLHVVSRTHLQRKGGGEQHLPGQTALHQGGGGGHHHGGVAPGHAVQGGQPGILPLAAVSGGAQLQFALRQAHRLHAQQNADIRRLTLNVLLIGTQEQQRTLRLCRQRGGEHGPVDGGKPRHGSAAGDGAAVQRRQQLLKLRQSR